MNLVIAGSRGIVNCNPTLIQFIEELALELGYPTAIYHGGCENSPDECAHGIAIGYRVEEHVIRPNYARAREQGIPEEAAPILRNNYLCEVGDALVAVWDGQSRGTEHVIATFEKKGKPYRVYRTDTCEIIRGPTQRSMF